MKEWKQGIFSSKESFYCGKCRSRHTFHEGHVPEEGDDGENTEQKQTQAQNPNKTVSEPQHEVDLVPKTQASPQPDVTQKRSTARLDASGAQQGDESASKNAQTPSSEENPQHISALEQQDSALLKGGDGERHTPAAKTRQDKHPDDLPPTPTKTPQIRNKGVTLVTMTTPKKAGNLKGGYTKDKPSGIPRVYFKF